MLNNTSDEIGLLGAGSQADEAESYLDTKKVIFRAVSEQYVGDNSHHIDILQPNNKDIPVVAAVGAPGLRKNMVKVWPGNDFATIISTKAVLDENVSIAHGSIIAPGVIITTNVTIGCHAIVNIGVTISHDCKIGDYATISPGAHIAGNVELGDGVFVGVGAVISNDVKVASGTVIGAGTVLLNDVLEENSVVVGVPGKVIKQNEDWLHAI